MNPNFQVLNDKRLYHFVDLKPTHPSVRRKRDLAQEEFIQRHDLVMIFQKKTISF